MNQLEILRESLGQCDEIILDALIMRNRIVEDIMAYKEANGLQILQPEQEAKQKEWLEKRMEGRRHKDEVSDVFECIRTNSKRIQARKLFNYNIVLIGFMGAGKSTISDFLKNVFAMDVVEMDQIIAQRQGMSISDIFETYGEQYFRDLETNLLIEMQSRSNVVISCGGGTPMRECNVVEMKKNGRVVLLTAKPSIRISASVRYIATYLCWLIWERLRSFPLSPERITLTGGPRGTATSCVSDVSGSSTLRAREFTTLWILQVRTSKERLLITVPDSSACVRTA